jgi:predicted transcriptional regulator
MAENNPSDTPNFIELAGDITIAWLQNPNVHPGVEDVPAFLQKMHAAIAGLDAAPVAEPVEVTHEPAVSVRSSVKPDHLVSLIDGKAYKTLKRHLAGHGLTPDEYRARYGSRLTIRWWRKAMPLSAGTLPKILALAASVPFLLGQTRGSRKARFHPLPMPSARA